MEKWVKFKPNKETGVAIGAGLLVIVLSLLMIFFQGESLLDFMMSVLLRDVLMLLGIGFCFVLYYVVIIKKSSLEGLGITKNKLGISLIINLILGMGLVFIFMKESSKGIVFNYETFCAIAYIAVAGVFEMIFLYGFLRHYLEEAFGILPAILLTATFYSFHHAGFQPEFIELFFVGIMYTTAFYFTRNIFAIFPVFWGVGAIWDVLVDSNAAENIKNTESLIVALVIALGMILYALYIRKRLKG